MWNYTLIWLGLCGMGGEARTLFDFTDERAAAQWQTVNDAVMGGVSQGFFRITPAKTLEFYGTLSLENNGGFASVRSRSRELNLRDGRRLIARVRGDGREYSLNLYVARPQVAFSYRWKFRTRRNEWMEVHAPLADFQATSFGEPVRGAGPIDPREVRAVGFLLGDKTAGPFKLEVEWIRVD